MVQSIYRSTIDCLYIYMYIRQRPHMTRGDDVLGLELTQQHHHRRLRHAHDGIIWFSREGIFLALWFQLSHSLSRLPVVGRSHAHGPSESARACLREAVCRGMHKPCHTCLKLNTHRARWRRWTERRICFWITSKPSWCAWFIFFDDDCGCRVLCIYSCYSHVRAHVSKHDEWWGSGWNGSIIINNNTNNNNNHHACPDL